jgi:hypothetical protein
MRRSAYWLNARNFSSRNARDHGTVREAFRHDGTCSNNAAIAEVDIFQYDDASSDPAVISDLHFADIHRQLVRWNATATRVIGIGDIDIRAKHVAIADLNVTAGVDHKIPIEVVVTSDVNANTVEGPVKRPEPASLVERVVVSDTDLRKAPASPLPFHAITPAHFHSKQTIAKKSYTTGESAWRTQSKLFEVH